MIDLERYVKKARARGIIRTKIIDTKTVVTGNWVRMKCGPD